MSGLNLSGQVSLWPGSLELWCGQYTVFFWEKVKITTEFKEKKMRREKEECERCSHFEEHPNTGSFVCTETEKKVPELTEGDGRRKEEKTKAR